MPKGRGDEQHRAGPVASLHRTRRRKVCGRFQFQRAVPVVVLHRASEWTGAVVSGKRKAPMPGSQHVSEYPTIMTSFQPNRAMSLAPGVRLGCYEVCAKLGEGGMGEVYRAFDTKLDRDVALKVLPQAFVNHPDRLARFEREAKVLASLNHPNIGHIYGLEEAAGVKALVLELVNGPTLEERMAQGPIDRD